MTPGIADPVGTLCDLVEAPADVFRATDLGETYGAAVGVLTTIGALVPGPPCQTVTCRACHNDHPAAVEFNSATGRSFHFCSEAGLVTLEDSDLATLCFDPEWLVEWLIRELPISPPIRRRVVVPGHVWHLGDALYDANAMTVIFARRVGNLAAIDRLVSALANLPTAPVGLVATTSRMMPRRIVSLQRYEFLDLREIAHFERDRLALDKLRLGSWIVEYRGAPPNQSPSGRAVVSSRKTRREPRRLDYRVADQPLIEEMRSMIQRGTARNATDAARAVAKRAAGNGKEASKVTRLAGGYIKRYQAG